jgi:hypothetical protein
MLLLPSLVSIPLLIACLAILALACIDLLRQ